MSANTPPNPYFNGINFNSSFFSTISNYLTQAIADSRYLRLIGGTLSGFLGIKIIPRVELDINGQAIINTGTYSSPSNGIYGSAGTRLILKEGLSNATPMALGADTNAITYGTPSGSEHNFYTGTNKQVIINSSGIVVNNSPSSGSGYLTLYGGGGGNLGGLVGFYNSSGTRLGYIGWNDAYNNILLECESTTTGFRIYNNGATSANLIVDGKVGIGTTNITTGANLDARGNTFINVPSTYNYSANGYGQPLTVAGSGTNPQMYIYDTTATANQYVGITIVANNTSNYCSIQAGKQTVGGVTLILNPAGGTVGINTTSTSGNALEVNGSIRSFNPGTIGSVVLQPGGSVQPGFVAFNAPNGARAGYIGYSDGGTNLTLTADTYTGWKVIGNLGIGTSPNSGSALDVNGNITARNYSGAYGYAKLTSGNSNFPGYVEFYNSSSIRAGYIGWSDASNYLYLETENGYLGYKILGNLALGGPITTLLNNWDMQIYQNNANTTGGNINIITYGNGGSINLNTNNLSRLVINPQGYIINNTGAFSTQMAQYTPTAIGTSGYWLVPVPYLVNNNYYNMGMLSIYNSDNNSWWSGHIVINTIALTVAYTAIASGGFIQFNSALVANGGGTWCIKVSFNNGVNITSGYILYFKYIG